MRAGVDGRAAASASGHELREVPYHVRKRLIEAGQEDDVVAAGSLRPGERPWSGRR